MSAKSISGRAFLLFQNIRADIIANNGAPVIVHNPATRELINAGILQEVAPAANVTRNGLQVTSYTVRLP